MDDTARIHAVEMMVKEGRRWLVVADQFSPEPARPDAVSSDRPVNS